MGKVERMNLDKYFYSVFNSKDIFKFYFENLFERCIDLKEVSII